MFIVSVNLLVFFLFVRSDGNESSGKLDLYIHTHKGRLMMIGSYSFMLMVVGPLSVV